MLKQILGVALLLTQPANDLATARTPLTQIHSLVLTETTLTGISARPARFENRLWYQVPNRWRTELDSNVMPPQITVSDGTDLWEYHPHERSVTVNRLSPNRDVLSHHFPLNHQVKDLGSLLRELRTCYSPKLMMTQSVAGREAQVIDLGATRCRAASAPERNGRRVIWVDRETLLLMRSVQWTPSGNVYEVREVSHIQVNIPIDPHRFTFTPPPEARVSDFRPKPPPSPKAYQGELRRLAKAVDFPLLAPSSLPQGYVPLWPRHEPYGVELGYLPAAEAWRNSPDLPSGINIIQAKATPSDVSGVPDRAEPVRLRRARGWFTPAIRQPDGTGVAAWLSLVQDGTRVSITGFSLSRAAIMRLGESLQPVPGGHAPLPHPVPRTLAEVRRRVPFPVFIPTRIPPGIRPEPPVGGEAPGDLVTITYHHPDGSVALQVSSGPAGCCLGVTPIQRRNPVRLPDGGTAYLLEGEPRFGGPILWWERGGSYIALSSPVFAKDELLRIAASLSSTADLGKTELPVRRPGR